MAFFSWLGFVGPGESGKSTIFKQIKIIYMNGFTKDELLNTRMAIYSNLMQCLTNICIAMRKLLIPSDNAENEVLVLFRLNLALFPLFLFKKKPPCFSHCLSPSSFSSSAAVVRFFLEGWDPGNFGDPTAVTAWPLTSHQGCQRDRKAPERFRFSTVRWALQGILPSRLCSIVWFNPRFFILFIDYFNSFLNSLFPFSFFENLHRFAEPDFLPTEQDALRVRVKTTGISEIHFQMGSIPIQYEHSNLLPPLSAPPSFLKSPFTAWLMSGDSGQSERNGFTALKMWRRWSFLWRWVATTNSWRRTTRKTGCWRR